MNDKVEIDGMKISQIFIDLINGERGKISIDNNFIVLAKAFEHPQDLPFFIEEIYDLKDYEYLPQHSEAWVKLAAINMMARRLSPG